MSERQEHKKRYSARIAWAFAVDAWLKREPSAIHIFKHRKWKKEQPKLEDYLK